MKLKKGDLVSHKELYDCRLHKVLGRCKDSEYYVKVEGYGDTLESKLLKHKKVHKLQFK